MTRGGVALALVALVLAGGLSACGKHSSLKPPEGEESRYTYPRTYPAPGSVLPRAPASREAPAHAGGLSPFPGSRTTTTYGEPPAR